MTTDSMVLERPQTTGVRDGIIDSDIHPSPRHGVASLRPYIAQRWWDHLQVYGDPHNGPYATLYAYPRYMPATARRDAWPEDGLPGSDLDLMRRQHLDPNNVALGILEPLGFGHTARNLDLAAAICAGVNDWQIDEFVEKEPRLMASVMIAPEDPLAAAAEIDRCAANKAFAQVQLPSITREPYGARRYWPIFEAAARNNLPIGLHVGGPTGSRTASGWPSYYNEEHFSLVASMQAQVTSLALEGVFEHFPSLKVMMIEGGLAWSIPLRERLDKLWHKMKSETPDCKRPPSDYIRESIYFSTQPVEEPDDPNDLAVIFGQLGWDRIVYASDYPHWDYDDPKYAFKGEMPDDKMALVMRENALGFYRLP